VLVRLNLAKQGCIEERREASGFRLQAWGIRKNWKEIPISFCGLAGYLTIIHYFYINVLIILFI
jgi:hypothetical protein